MVSAGLSPSLLQRRLEAEEAIARGLVVHTLSDDASGAAGSAAAVPLTKQGDLQLYSDVCTMSHDYALIRLLYCEFPDSFT